MIYVCTIIQILIVLGLCITIFNLGRKKDSEYYTDYRHGKLVLRIFKPEFEYQAIGNLNKYSILDRGVFSQYYLWALIDTQHGRKRK